MLITAGIGIRSVDKSEGIVVGSEARVKTESRNKTKRSRIVWVCANTFDQETCPNQAHSLCTAEG
jgi:hypothetical protein